MRIISANDLTESIKSMGLSEKTEIVKVLQRELEKSRGLQNEQKIELESLRETCHKLTKDCDKFETNNDQYKVPFMIIFTPTVPIVVLT